MREYSAGSIRQTFERKQYKHMTPGAEFLVLSISCSFQASPIGWCSTGKAGWGVGFCARNWSEASQVHQRHGWNKLQKGHFWNGQTQNSAQGITARKNKPHQVLHGSLPKCCNTLHRRSPLHSTTEHTHSSQRGRKKRTRQHIGHGPKNE